jgi:hypothetical protein
MNFRLLEKGMLGCLLLLAGTALCAAVPPAAKPAPEPAKDAPADSSNPYSIIVEANVFHLNPPPPPPPPEQPKLDLPEIKITGFVNIGNQSKVLFRSQPKDKKEGPFYYSLTEGENGASGSHKLELVKIHPSQDGVDVINDGVAATLTVKDDTLGAVAGATPPAAPGARREGPPGFTPGNAVPGRQLFRPGPPGMPGANPNGFQFPSHMRRNVPQ